MSIAATAASPVGLRERHKREKRARIIAAARDLFARHGFEATTTQAVAAAAGIGAGTLFLYAKTKEDLLVLVFQRELSRVVEDSFASLPTGADLLHQLLHLFDAVIEHHERHMALGRPFAKELMFVSESSRPEMSAFMAAWMARLEAVFEQARRRGAIAARADCRLLATSSFALFFFRLQNWVGGYIGRDRLEHELRELLRLLLRGGESKQE